MIAETFCDGAHAMLAIGYEVQNETVTKIFCLDPGNMISDYSYWNAVIRLNERTNSNIGIYAYLKIIVQMSILVKH